MLKSFQKI